MTQKYQIFACPHSMMIVDSFKEMHSFELMVLFFLSEQIKSFGKEQPEC